MKTGKLFTIDVEIAEKLKNLNGSKLVNDLLKEYFELRTGKNTLKDEKEAVLKDILKKKSNFRKKLRSFLNGIHLTWIIFARHGLKKGLRILQDLKSSSISGNEIEGTKDQQLTLYLNNLNEHGDYIKNTERSCDE